MLAHGPGVLGLAAIAWVHSPSLVCFFCICRHFGPVDASCSPRPDPSSCVRAVAEMVWFVFSVLPLLISAYFPNLFCLISGLGRLTLCAPVSIFLSVEICFGSVFLPVSKSALSEVGCEGGSRS